MQKLFRLPFLFLLAAGCIGLLLRWYFVSPVPWLTYPNWLHGHSHIMFLGWIFNLLLTAYIFNYSLWKTSRYRTLFWVIQGLLAGMLISFPIQGYGVISICLSVLHTICIYLFTIWFFKDVPNSSLLPSLWCARVSLLLFALASIGPFLLGVLKANGLGHSAWYHHVVYYYLHFQYNGVFIFGALSLWFQLVERKQVQLDLVQSRRVCILLLVSLFPSYFLSVLWSKPSVIFNFIGLFGACVQLVALLYFIRLKRKHDLKANKHARILMLLALVCFGIKCILQLASAHPLIAQMAFEVRPFIIAYLHLVVIGTISFFLLAWSLEMEIITLRSPLAVILLVTGFLGTELLMIISGILGSNISPTTVLLFLFSAVLLSGFGIFTLRAFAQSSAQPAY